MILTEDMRERTSRLWGRYFPLERLGAFTGNSKDTRVSIIETFFSILRKPETGSLLNTSTWKHDGSVYFDVQELASTLLFPDFVNTLRSRPREVCGCLGVALSLIAAERIPEAQKLDSLWAIHPRFTNLGEETPFEHLNSSCVGQFVCFRGHVVRVSAPRPLVTGGWFACVKCNQDTWQAFEDGVFCIPSNCATASCRSKTLELRRNRVSTQEYQTVRLQELDQGGDSAARVPRTQEVEVRGWESINRCVAGDLVVVVGQVNTAQKESRRGFGKQLRESGIHTLYVLASSLTCQRGSVAGSMSKGGHAPGTVPRALSESGTGSTFQDAEVAMFREIAGTDCLGRLVASLCPTIFGHDLVKFGLLLGMFGGTRQGAGDGRGVSTRPDIHVLVVGDPGLGKSQLLRASANCAPRVVSICGNTATTAGLTVAVTREGRNDTALEAGALVLADRGICCIDELDKMTSDAHALLEAMEQQRVSVAKAGAITSVRCRTTVLAAANPCGGHYNRRKTVCENLKMNAALLSRFDLVFLIVDKPDARHDQMISDHILKTRALAEEFTDVGHRSSSAFGASADPISSTGTGFNSLSARLASAVSSHSHIVPADVIRRYVEYARMHVRSRLTVGAAKVLQKL